MTETKLTGILFDLYDRGVTGLLVLYSGGGGDGDIDDVVYTMDKLDDDAEKALSSIDSIDLYTPSANYLRHLGQSIHDELADYIRFNVLETWNMEKWWKDDGGYGKVSILVPSGKYRVENVVYYTTSETYLHKNDLFTQIDN
jgi:hypothetical protein